MKYPSKPPAYHTLIKEASDKGRLAAVLSAPAVSDDRYLHWDKFRYRKTTGELSVRESWLAAKMRRTQYLQNTALLDKKGTPFQFGVPPSVQKLLHEIDLSCGGKVSLPEPLLNPSTRDKYMVGSLMDEGITSSLLEGAITTRAKAKQLITSGRKPRELAEWMVTNNFRTMRMIADKWKNEPLSKELVFKIHRTITANTLDKAEQAGRFRLQDEAVDVGDEITGDVFHIPPDASELDTRIAEMCKFANDASDERFIHPVVRAIILHFWLAFDHPFADGNGRTARALFYWYMLRNNYWLFEFVSLSQILLRAPVKYYKAFIYSETDDNDLTYFIIQQAKTIGDAIRVLHEQVARKSSEIQASEKILRGLQLNHRQRELLGHALRSPGSFYTAYGHKTKQAVSEETARSDLKDLAKRGLLEAVKANGKQVNYNAPYDLLERINGDPSADGPLFDHSGHGNTSTI